MSDREKFEAWFVDHNMKTRPPQDYWFALDEDGKYIERDVFEAYRVWKACAESMQAEIDKRDARIAQLEEALKGWSGIINHQYTASWDAMNFLQTADNIGQEALSTSSDTWLAEHDKERDAEIAELKNRLAISQVLNIRMCGEGAPEELWEEVAQEELTSLLAKERERCAEVMDKFNAVYYATEIRSLK